MSKRSKKTIRCLGCGVIRRHNRSYKVRVREITKSTITGEIKKTDLVTRICALCAYHAGYKVKLTDLEKKELGITEINNE